MHENYIHMCAHRVVNAEYSQPLTSHTLQDSQSFLTSGQLQILVAKEKLKLLTAWNLYDGDIAKSLLNFIGCVVKRTPSYDVQQWLAVSSVFISAVRSQLIFLR